MFALTLALVVAGATLLAVLGLVAARRVLPRPLLERHNTVVGHGYAVLSLFTGVLLALMVVAVWERYVEALEITEREANALADLFGAAAAFAPPERDRLMNAIREYAFLVETEEWPAMAEERESARAWHAYATIRDGYLSLVPQTEREALWLRWSIERLNELGDERRLRLLRSRADLPTPMWVVLGILSVATVAFSYLFGVRELHFHALVTGAIAAALALTLTLVAALQHPFGRLSGVSPEAFRELRVSFGQPPPR
ncbi:MAG TPA: hypothetical protein VF192_06115 [Longimicrobiales bacterium]